MARCLPTFRASARSACLKDFRFLKDAITKNQIQYFSSQLDYFYVEQGMSKDSLLFVNFS